MRKANTSCAPVEGGQRGGDLAPLLKLELVGQQQAVRDAACTAHGQAQPMHAFTTCDMVAQTAVVALAAGGA